MKPAAKKPVVKKPAQKPTANMPGLIPISVCMIAKNEERYLDKCLQLLSAYPFEIVVVDTGSSDRTVEIARRYTDKVFHFDWCNDFSAARNYSVAQASHEWILAMDCDEFLEELDIQALDQAIRQHPHGAGMLLSHNPYQEQSSHQKNSAAAGPTTARILTERIARLFSRKEYLYQGIIHEQVARKDGQEPEYFPIPLSCYHEGYRSPDIAGAKAARNLELLLLALQQKGADPYICFQIGKSYTALRQPEKAYEYYSQGLSFDVNPRLEYVQTMVESYGYCMLELKRFQEALQFENIYQEFAVRADFPFLMGLIYMNNGLFDQAIAEFKKAVTFSAYSVEGVNSYSAYYNIGVIYECSGQLAQARKYYQKCGPYEPAALRIRELGTTK